MDDGFRPAVEPPSEATADDASLWFAFRGAEMLVHGPDAVAVIPAGIDLAAVGLVPRRRHYLGTLGGRGCFAVEVEDTVDPPVGMAFESLRPLYGRLDDLRFALAGRALQVVEWDRTHRFCGRCGTPTEPVPGERAKKCPRCGLTSYPRLAPAVIVLIHRGRELLLARGHQFPEGLYGLVAGFVEPGESLEEAVRRETSEEIGIELADVRYFGSQPWPFPHSLMIGFTARYAGGELRPAPHEIAAAGWFTIDNLPSIPPPLSIARKLIDAFIEGRGGWS